MYENKNTTQNQKEIFRELFTSVVYITKVTKQKGIMSNFFDKNKIKAKFESSEKLLLLTLSLMCNAYAPPTFNFYINLEFEKLIKNSLSELELTELVLTKELIGYIYKADVNAIYELICHVGTGELRNELVPVPNWVDLE